MLREFSLLNCLVSIELMKYLKFLTYLFYLLSLWLLVIKSGGYGLCKGEGTMGKVWQCLELAIHLVDYRWVLSGSKKSMKR